MLSLFWKKMSGIGLFLQGTTNKLLISNGIPSLCALSMEHRQTEDHTWLKDGAHLPPGPVLQGSQIFSWLQIHTDLWGALKQTLSPRRRKKVQHSVDKNHTADFRNLFFFRFMMCIHTLLNITSVTDKIELKTCNLIASHLPLAQHISIKTLRLGPSACCYSSVTALSHTTTIMPWHPVTARLTGDYKTLRHYLVTFIRTTVTWR